MKTVKKTTSKKPLFVVDLTKCETPDDVKFEFIKAKATSGVKISLEDIAFILGIGADMALEFAYNKVKDLSNTVYCATVDKDKVAKIINIIEKKEPWYKRLWKKIKYAFTW